MFQKVPGKCASNKIAIGNLSTMGFKQSTGTVSVTSILFVLIFALGNLIYEHHGFIIIHLKAECCLYLVYACKQNRNLTVMVSK